MTPPSEKLAGSLDVLRSLQERGVVAVRAADLPRSHRERLVRHGILLPVMKGWYVAGAPDRSAGDGTAWYASFWRFCAGYLNARFGAAWCLSPEQSLTLHAGNRTVPGQFSSGLRGGATGSHRCFTRRLCWKSAPRCPMPGTSWKWTACARSARPPPWSPAQPDSSAGIRSMHARRSPSCATHRSCRPASWTAVTAPSPDRRAVAGEPSGVVAEADHRIWYRELFAPSVAAGLVRPADLAGYRDAPVYLQRSMHVPPSPSAVRDAMPSLFGLLREESDPAVRVVLGHFLFVYVHPCPDGNGRVGRFLMNLMLTAAGYPWTVIPVERRDTYMAALEAASVGLNIGPFADFLAGLVGDGAGRGEDAG